MITHQEKVSLIWNIAELLRGDYKPREYVDVILPLVVLRRLDLAIAPTRKAVWEAYDTYRDRLDKIENFLETLVKAANGLLVYNTSKYDWRRLLEAQDDLAENLIAYLNGFSPDVQDIIEKFDFRRQVYRLKSANLLLPVMQAFANIPLHPNEVDNHEMGDIFEELIRRFSEQYNETAGEHFTPREVIRLMVHLLLDENSPILRQPNAICTIYDPACGTGGMLTEAKKYIQQRNPSATVFLYGQEINPSTYAVAKSDMLLKGDKAEQLAFGNTFSDDGHANREFNLMLSNPPFGVDWKKVEWVIKRESETLGFDGRFGAGWPRTSDGSLLFLQHMLSKMERKEESRIVIVFNGSPLFTGDPDSGESRIRRWIMEKDWLEGIVALPDQLFYNTGINSYLWVLTNRKSEKRQGRVQLVNATSTEFNQKMQKSKGDKRKEISETQIGHISAIYHQFEEGEYCKIFDNIDFGYRKVRIERPLRLNFQVTLERLAKLEQESAFKSLTDLGKDARRSKSPEEIAEGRRLQQDIVAMLEEFGQETYRNRDRFEQDLRKFVTKHNLQLHNSLFKAIMSALSERDENADICIDPKTKNWEPDPELRDYENIPLSEDIWLKPGDSIYDEKVPLKTSVDAYFEREVKPFIKDAYIDRDFTDPIDRGVGRVGYEINFTRYFYRYQSPRPLEVIDQEIKQLEKQILDMLAEVE